MYKIINSTILIITLIAGFVLGAIVASIIPFYVGEIHITTSIDTHKSFGRELNQCNIQLIEKNNIIEREKKACICESKGFSFWSGFLSFIIGALATIYVILYGYPLMKNKLDQKKKDKG